MLLYNFKQVSPSLACSGQPREGQLAQIAEAGYSVVINLGMTDTKYALNDEKASVEALGLIYHHIPVVFEDPKPDQLDDFISLMNGHQSEKTLVHCAANYRATAFTGLYLFSAKKLDKGEMFAFIEEIWQPDPTWEQFIEECVERIAQRR